MNPYEILGLKYPCDKEEIKARYYELAKKHHPDKLQHLSKEDIEFHEEQFKKINIAYELLKNKEFQYSEEKNEWKDMWDNDFINNILHNVINSVKNYRNARQVSDHNINVNVSIEDVFNKKEKKLRLFLTDHTEPIFININCGEYPTIEIQYDEITYIYITLHILKDSLFSLDISTNDILYTLNITLYEYLNGCVKKILYLDKSIQTITIHPCCIDTIYIDNIGFNSIGKLVIFINVVLPTKAQVDSFDSSSSKKEKLFKYIKKLTDAPP